MGILTVVLIPIFFIVTVSGLGCPAPVDPPHGKITRITAEVQCNHGEEVKGSLTCMLDKTGLYWRANIECPIRGCQYKLDTVFVIDGSSTVGLAYFNRIIKFIQDSIPFWSVKPDNTHIGAVIYSTDSVQYFHLTGDSSMVKTTLGKFVFPGGRTATYKGMEKAKEMLMNGRSSVNRVIVVITDGNFQGQANINPDTFRAGGRIDVMAIGVGDNQMQKELERISSSSEYVFSIKDEQKFPTALRKLSDAACSIGK